MRQVRLVQPQSPTRLMGRKVRFEDGSVEAGDAIVDATGYRSSFPFFKDPALLPDAVRSKPSPAASALW